MAQTGQAKHQEAGNWQAMGAKTAEPSLARAKRRVQAQCASTAKRGKASCASIQWRNTGAGCKRMGRNGASAQGFWHGYVFAIALHKARFGMGAGRGARRGGRLAAVGAVGTLHRAS